MEKHGGLPPPDNNGGACKGKHSRAPSHDAPGHVEGSLHRRDPVCGGQIVGWRRQRSKGQTEGRRQKENAGSANDECTRVRRIAAAGLAVLALVRRPGVRGQGLPRRSARPPRSSCSTARRSRISTPGSSITTTRIPRRSSLSSIRLTARRPFASAGRSGAGLTKQAYRDYRLIAEFRWGGVTWGPEDPHPRQRRAAARPRPHGQHRQGLQRSVADVARIPDHRRGRGRLLAGGGLHRDW